MIGTPLKRFRFLSLLSPPLPGATASPPPTISTVNPICSSLVCMALRTSSLRCEGTTHLPVDAPTTVRDITDSSPLSPSHLARLHLAVGRVESPGRREGVGLSVCCERLLYFSLLVFQFGYCSHIWWRTMRSRRCWSSARVVENEQARLDVSLAPPLIASDQSSYRAVEITSGSIERNSSNRPCCLPLPQILGCSECRRDRDPTAIAEALSTHVNMTMLVLRHSILIRRLQSFR